MRLPLDPTGKSDRPVHLVYEDPILAQHDRTGTAMRRLGEALIGRDVPLHELEALERWADEHAARLEQLEAVTRADDYQARRYTIAPPRHGDRLISFSDRPVSGPANPTATDLIVWRDGDVVRAVARFGRLAEASPGRAHGGVTASVFDDVMGYVMIIEATAAYTGELFVRYNAPMLIGVPVHFEAKVAERGERVWTLEATARLHEPDGQLCGEASGRFVVVGPEKFGLPPGTAAPAD
ncbi:MAG: PaaI family thioesterase [Acidimicrobiales bacterium]